MPEGRRRRFSVEQIEQLFELVSERLVQVVSAKVEHLLRNSELGKKLGLEPSAAPPQSLLDYTSEAQEKPGSSSTKERKKCTVEGCQEPARARGLCSRHYQKQRYEEKHQAQARRGTGECSVENCHEKVYANDMCSRHFMEWVRSRRKE